MHLTDELAERLLAGSLPGRDAETLRRHVVSCASCTDRLRRHEADHGRIEQALRALDHPPPIVGARAIIARASARRWGVGRVAAGIALVGGATAALAMPGSPIARWWRAGPEVPVPAPATTASRVPVAAAAAGITLVPDVAFDLTFEAPQAVGAMRVSIVPQSEVSVHTTSGAVEYSVLPTGVVVRNRASSASYEVRVPHDLRRLRVRVGGELVFVKERDAVTTAGVRDAQGAYVVRVAAPGAAAR